MQLEHKPDFEDACRRIDAWWAGEIVDRVPVMLTAPQGVSQPEPGPASDLLRYWTDPELVIPRAEGALGTTYFAGEAMPVLYPVSTGLVAILAGYLGCPVRLLDTRTSWAYPIIDDWDDPPAFEFDPTNEWWRRSEKLLAAASERAHGRYLIGLPDLNGPGEILARLRGTEPLCFDVVERPDLVREATEKITLAWYRYYEACLGIIHQRVPGSITWMGIWSMTPAVDLQCDFSCMISPEAFNGLFLPSIERQAEWVARTVYHLDGPDAVRHLPALLDLPELDAIQWIPGAGALPMSRWTDVCRTILEGGKLLYIGCEADEVEFLLSELPQKGLLLRTSCRSVEEADALLENVARWTR